MESDLFTNVRLQVEMYSTGRRFLAWIALESVVIGRDWISESREVTVEANFCRSTLSTGREFNENGLSGSPKGAAILSSTDSI